MKPDYLKLIKFVQLFDESAADYLLNEAIHLKNFEYRFRLDCCFLWDLSPQGHDYWADINYQIIYFLRSAHKIGIRSEIWE